MLRHSARCFACLLPFALALACLAALVTPQAQGANLTFTLTPTTNVWSTDTWSSTISAIAAGDIAQFNTAGTATTSVDTSVTLGQLQTGTTGGSIWNLTAGGGVLTLDGTGITSGNQAFGFAGVAAIASRNALGNLTIAPDISFGTTALDIGATNTGTVTINGHLSATAAQTLNFRGSGSGTVTVNGTIGNTGSAISVNVARSGGSTIFTAANGYTGATTVTQGNLTFSGAGSAASSALTVGAGGSTNVTTLTVAPAVAGTTTRSADLTWNAGRVGGGANNLFNFTVTNVTGGNVIENFGALTLSGGLLRGSISANATGNTRVVFDSLSRSAGSIFSFTRSATGIGANSLASQTANTANIMFNTAPTLSGNGGTGTSVSILPYVNLATATPATYDATNGLRPLNTTTEMVTLASGLSLGTGSAGQNAKISANTTLSANTTINSLFGTGGTITFGSDSTVLKVSSGFIGASVGFTIGTGTTGGNGILDFGTAEGIIMVENSRTLVVNSAITGSGGLTIVLDNFNNNNSNAVLNGANTFTGVTRLLGNRNEEMTVRLTNSLALQNTTLDYNNYGASFTFGNGGTSGQIAYTFGGLKGAQGINLNNNNTSVGVVALTVGGNNESTTYSGVLSDTVDGGSLIKTGTGTLTLSGASTYTGGTTINNGTLELGVASAISTSAGAITFGGGTLKYGTGVTTDYSARIAAGTSASAMRIDTGANAVTFTTALTSSQSGGLVKSGAGTLTLGNATNAFTGGVIISNGTLISTGSNNGSPNGQGALGTNAIQLGDSSNNNVTLQLSNWNNLTSSNTVNVVGTGTHTLVGTHNNTGQVHIAGAAITLNTNNLTIRNTSLAGWRINGGVTGTGNLVFENNNTSGTGNDISVRSALNNTGTVTNAGTGNYNLAISGTNGGSIGANVTGVIQNSSTSSFDLNAVISAFNTASVEVRAGSMLLNNATALRVANSVSVGSGGTLDVRQSNTIAGLNNISGSGGSVTNNNTADTTLTVGAASGSHSFSGIISDGATNKLSLTKSGAGSQTLSGANTYSGTTNLTAGTLLINNSTGSGTGSGVVVTTASTILGGTGTLSPGTGNGITINGSLAPGDSATNSGVGTLTFTPADANATFGSTATADFQLLTNGTHGYSVTYNPDGTISTLSGTYVSGGNDRLIFTGGASNLLDFSSLGAGNYNLTFGAGYTPAANDLFDLIDWMNLTGSGLLNNEASAIAGLSSTQLDLPLLSGGLVWDTTQFTSHGVVGIYNSVVPEPSRALLLMLGLVSTLWQRRRRHS